MKGLIFFSITLIALLLLRCTHEDDRNSSEIGIAVAEKIIKESTFELKSIPFESSMNIQSLDYENEFTETLNGSYYSISEIISNKDTTISLGLSYSGDLKIYLNRKIIFEGTETSPAHFQEIAYNMFSFQDTVETSILKGENNILIELEKMSSRPIVFIREIPHEVGAPLTAEFVMNYLGYQNLTDQWLSVGPIPEKNNIKEEVLGGLIHEEYNFDNKKYKWQLIKEKSLKEIVIPDTNTYKRESYLEWHYANGTLLFGLQALSDALNEPEYSDFVKKAIYFTLENYDLFKYQYHNLHAFRSSNHRMFRKTMLDDTGAPAIPYLDYFLRSGDESVRFIIDDMNEYVTKGQVRLEDGTFCRPEPTKMTIWADDLFMSVPFLIRMGELTNDRKYYDDAANQVINFNKYLFDEEAGVYKHGWFGKIREKSVALWGRANGWLVWATSEALLHIPNDYKDYEKIVSIFKTHIDGLLTYQSEEGMWHQVLDQPESFKETSCTAMFIIGILRGVENGWLPADYKEKALLAWDELKSNILVDGTVVDICRGTGIGFDLDFYFNRTRFDNDPRGLGAVLTAISEIIKIEK